jgi:hypothetical protein
VATLGRSAKESATFAVTEGNANGTPVPIRPAPVAIQQGWLKAPKSRVSPEHLVRK